MRNREELIKESIKDDGWGDRNNMEPVMLEVLLDIRDLLIKKTQSKSSTHRERSKA